MLLNVSNVELKDSAQIFRLWYMVIGHTNMMLTMEYFYFAKNASKWQPRTWESSKTLKNKKKFHSLKSQDVKDVNKTDKSQLLWQPVPRLKSAGEYAHVRVCSTTYCGRGRRNAGNGCDEPCYSAGSCRVPWQSLDNSLFASLHPTSLIETHGHCQNSNQSCWCYVMKVGTVAYCIIEHCRRKVTTSDDVCLTYHVNVYFSSMVCSVSWCASWSLWLSQITRRW